MWGSQCRVYDKHQSSEGLAFFLFLHYFKRVTAGIRQPSNWVRLSLGYLPETFFSEMQMLHGVICYQVVQDVIHIVLKSNRLAL